jgi:hypothetical protein
MIGIHSAITPSPAINRPITIVEAVNCRATTGK